MSFPSTLDTFPVVLPTDLQDDAGKELDVLFNRATAGLVAVETRLGVTGSTDPTSVEARLSAKAPLASPTFSGTVSGITAAMVGAEPAGVSAADITDSTAAGRAILTAADAPAQRTALGLGTAATSASSAFAAASHAHSTAEITSLSTYLTDFLKSAGMPVPIVSIGIPFAIFPGNGSNAGLQFTGSAGAFTLSASLFANLWNQLAAGFWMYLPANFGGQTIAAGWYWATMSSATAGIVYTNTYSSGLPVSVDSPTAFGANLTGWLTQTTAEITGPTGFTLPGGSLGPNGFLDWWFRTSGGNSGTVKTIRGKAGTATIGAVAYSVSPNGEYQGRLYNQGKTNRQGSMRNGTSTSGVGTAGASMTTTEYSAIDTTSDQTLSITLQTAGSSEGIVLLGASFESSYRA